jgi:hypothetical protein
MTPPIVDLSDPEAVKRELLDEDAVVRAEFAAHLDDELTELAGAGSLFPSHTRAQRSSQSS